MKFQEKFKIIRESNPVNERVINELSEYEYDGIVDFVSSPSFVFDLDHNVILEIDETSSKERIEKDFFIKKGPELYKIGKNTKFIQVSTFSLKRDFNLQDFFDKYQDSDCIVFYTPTESGGGTVFHTGNQIRACVIKNKDQIKHS